MGCDMYHHNVNPPKFILGFIKQSNDILIVGNICFDDYRSNTMRPTDVAGDFFGGISRAIVINNHISSMSGQSLCNSSSEATTGTSDCGG